MEPAVELRRLGRTELSRVVEIDRRERIDVLYDQHGSQLAARRGDWSAPAWDPDGHGEHSVEAQVNTLEHYVDTVRDGRSIDAPDSRPTVPQPA